MAKVFLYADGACSGNPGPGGFAWAIFTDGVTSPSMQGGSGAEHTTNNIMELTALRDGLAAVAAVRVALRVTEVVLRLDSEYALKGMTEWLAGWKARAWRTAAGKPVANAALWHEVDDLRQQLTDAGITLTPSWVKGHAGEPGNELVDRLAGSFRDQAKAGIRPATDPAPLIAPAVAGTAGSKPSPRQIIALAALIEDVNEGRLSLDNFHASLRDRREELGLA